MYYNPPTHKGIYFSIENGIDLLPKTNKKVLSSDQVKDVKQLYSLLYPNHQIN